MSNNEETNIKFTYVLRKFKYTNKAGRKITGGIRE
jgi:hypothetical protein